MLLLPINRGGGRNLSASRSSRQQPSAPQEPSPQRAGCYGYLPRVPACQPPSPVQPPESALTRMSPGEEGWASRQLGPCPRRAQAGARPQGLCLCWGGAQALSSSFLQMAHLPRPLDMNVSSLLSHKPGTGTGSLTRLLMQQKPPQVPSPALPRTAAHPWCSRKSAAFWPGLPFAKAKVTAKVRVLPGKQYKSGCSHSRGFTKWC